jgi:hypothetical protein
MGPLSAKAGTEARVADRAESSTGNGPRFFDRADTTTKTSEIASGVATRNVDRPSQTAIASGALARRQGCFSSFVGSGKRRPIHPPARIRINPPELIFSSDRGRRFAPRKTLSRFEDDGFTDLLNTPARDRTSRDNRLSIGPACSSS